MVTTQAASSLCEAIESKLRELEEAVSAVPEDVAGRRPGDAQWCVKETLSHLIGDPDNSFLATVRRFTQEEETSLIGIVTGLPYYSPDRQKQTMADLLSEVRRQYDEIAAFVGGLDAEQLARTARIPFLRDTPVGEYPTLEQWVGALMNFHVTDHINQIHVTREQA